MPFLCHFSAAVRRLLLAGMLLQAGALVAAAPPPDKAPTAEFTFDASAPEGVRTTLRGDAAFFQAVHRTGGEVDAGLAWRVQTRAAFGEGTLSFGLDRARIAGDLALVLRADWDTDSDVTIQLFDAAGTSLAVDLFGNPAQTAAAAATDTFIVPLTRYPSATVLTVRRLSGPLTVHAAGLFPVLGELPASAETQSAIAAQLGLVYGGAGSAGAGAGKTKAANFGTVHASEPLEQVNQLGAAELARANYPTLRRLAQEPLTSAEIAASGTTFEFTKEAMRSLALQSSSTLKQPFFTSSNGVTECLLTNRHTLGLMSVPLTSAEKERFYKEHGYPILEFKIAHDAIAVLVNAANPVTELTVPQLDAIFSQEPHAGAGAPIRDWHEVRGGGGAIIPFGGRPGWGTSVAFQQMVLKGGKFREDLGMGDVVFRRGVEKEVAGNPAAIGYVSMRPRQPDVRALAIAANSGEKAWPADAVYSGKYPLQRTFYGYLARPTLEAATPMEREMVNLLLSDIGQKMVARSGSLPLSAQETIEARANLGLPR